MIACHLIACSVVSGACMLPNFFVCLFIFALVIACTVKSEYNMQ